MENVFSECVWKVSTLASVGTSSRTGRVYVCGYGIRQQFTLFAAC